MWGLALHAQDSANLYSVNVYEDLDAQPNLYLYRWNAGAATQLDAAAIGAIAPNVWQRLTVKIHSSTIEVGVNGRAWITANDSSSFTSGRVALYGEGGTVAQFNDVFVRKYAATEPTVSIGPEQGL